MTSSINRIGREVAINEAQWDTFCSPVQDCDGEKPLNGVKTDLGILPVLSFSFVGGIRATAPASIAGFLFT